MRLEREAGTRACRGWEALLGLFFFFFFFFGVYPQNLVPRVLSRGESRSDLPFEKLPLVALERMNGKHP